MNEEDEEEDDDDDDIPKNFKIYIFMKLIQIDIIYNKFTLY